MWFHIQCSYLRLLYRASEGKRSHCHRAMVSGSASSVIASVEPRGTALMVPLPVILAGPPMPSQYWQALLVVHLQTPQFTMFEGHSPFLPLLTALTGRLAPDGRLMLPTRAGPPLPSHHWQADSTVHSQTPQSTLPARPQVAKCRGPVPCSVLLNLPALRSANASLRVTRSMRKAAMIARNYDLWNAALCAVSWNRPNSYGIRSLPITRLQGLVAGLDLPQPKKR